MGRPSNRAERRSEIVAAFSRVLAHHGYAGSTIAAVAAEAGIAPGLIHHYFNNKEELLGALVDALIGGFRKRVGAYEHENDRLMAYVDGALKLDDRADVTAARCWVGIFSEAIREPSLFARMRRMIDTEIETIVHRSKGTLNVHQASSVLAFIIGALVVGAFVPKKAAGFAAPGIKQLIASMR